MINLEAIIREHLKDSVPRAEFLVNDIWITVYSPAISKESSVIDGFSRPRAGNSSESIWIDVAKVTAFRYVS